MEGWSRHIGAAIIAQVGGGQWTDVFESSQSRAGGSKRTKVAREFEEYKRNAKSKRLKFSEEELVPPGRPRQFKDNKTELMTKNSLFKSFRLPLGKFRDMASKRPTLQLIKTKVGNMKFRPPVWEGSLKKIELPRRLLEELRETRWFSKTEIGRYYLEWLRRSSPVEPLAVSAQEPGSITFTGGHTSVFGAVVESLQMSIDPDVLEICFNAFLEDEDVREAMFRSLTARKCAVELGMEECSSYVHDLVDISWMGLPQPRLDQVLQFTKLFTSRGVLTIVKDEETNRLIVSLGEKVPLGNGLGMLVSEHSRRGARTLCAHFGNLARVTPSSILTREGVKPALLKHLEKSWPLLFPPSASEALPSDPPPPSILKRKRLPSESQASTEAEPSTPPPRKYKKKRPASESAAAH